MATLRVLIVVGLLVVPLPLGILLKDTYPLASRLCLGLFVVTILALLVAAVLHARCEARTRRHLSLLRPDPAKPHGADVLALGFLCTLAVVGFGTALANELSRAVIGATGVFAAGTLIALAYRMWPRRTDRRQPEVRFDVALAYREFARTWMAPEEPLDFVPSLLELPEGPQAWRDQDCTVLPAVVVDLAEDGDESSTRYTASVYYELDGQPCIAGIHLYEREFATLSAMVKGRPLQGNYFAVLVHPEQPNVAQFYDCSCAQMGGT
jgi:hypothetical protein